MFGDNKDKERIKSVYVTSLEWFANVAAVAVTFFWTPMLMNWSHPFIRDFTLNNYPRELLVPVEFAWFFILGGLVFFISRASLALVLIGAGLALFMRFFA
ncbi:MAG: hypothetical protein ACE360_00560 [Hyphomicrobiales bacterium]